MERTRLGFLMIISVCLLSACTVRTCTFKYEVNSETVAHDTSDSREVTKEGIDGLSPTALKLESMGLVNISDTDPSIAVEMVYATPGNFTGEILYGDLTEAYFLPEAARKLAEAQRILKERYPEYSLVIYDAARPMSVQRRMRETAVRMGKQYYVANPAYGGGLHNYGAAADVSILDGGGNPLPMGTDYDHLGPEANTDKEQELLNSGKISREELSNRLLLREVMRSAGFRTIASEWWHFNLCGREEAKKKYALIDF